MQYTVTSLPVGGQLEFSSNSGSSISQFTQADIDVGRVIYRHAGGDEAEDSFLFSVDNGQGSVVNDITYEIGIVQKVVSQRIVIEGGKVLLSWINLMAGNFREWRYGVVVTESIQSHLQMGHWFTSRKCRNDWQKIWLH